MSIIVSCTQSPYNGGAATNSYALIKYLRSNGFNVAGIFFIKRGEVADPDGIGGVFGCIQGDNLSINNVKESCIKRLGSNPKLILAKNYVAPVISKRMFPMAKVVYLVSGAPNMMEFSKRNISAVKLINNYERFEGTRLGASYDGIVNSEEKLCVMEVDSFLFNSKISKDLFLKNYKDLLNGKDLSTPINTSIFLNGDFPPVKENDFLKRDIDVLFASSRLTRQVKNYPLASEIFNSKEFIASGRKAIVVGGDFKYFIKQNKNKNVKFVGYQKNLNLLRMMHRTKVVLSTSYFDASPNLLTEAVNSGANILCSKNCGWSELYDKNSVCDDVYDIKEWLQNLNVLCEKRHKYDFDLRKNELEFKNYIMGMLK